MATTLQKQITDLAKKLGEDVKVIEETKVEATDISDSLAIYDAEIKNYIWLKNMLELFRSFF